MRVQRRERERGEAKVKTAGGARGRYSIAYARYCCSAYVTVALRICK